jgi:hypothetical protein
MVDRERASERTGPEGAREDKKFKKEMLVVSTVHTLLGIFYND